MSPPPSARSGGGPSKRRDAGTGLPSNDAVVDFLEQAESAVPKRELTRAFGIGGDLRVPFKEQLKELEGQGSIIRTRGKEYTVPKGLPTVMVLRVTGQDIDGETLARPSTWREAEAPPPIYVVENTKKPGPATGGLQEGDRILARLRRSSEGTYEARIIRRLEGGPTRVLGTLEPVSGGFMLRPTNRKAKREYFVPSADAKGAGSDDLVLAEPVSGPRTQRDRHARIIEILGDMRSPRAISLIAIHHHDIPVDFPAEAVAEAEAGELPEVRGRTDLREVPLVTIDGADARDFDDAVWAQRADDGSGDWHIIVAIADVAEYVRPGQALDKAAYDRGNSVYFADRVVPMLPEALSNELCSLKPAVDRACLAMRMRVTAKGKLVSYGVERALMRSRARLTYDQVQAARDGMPDETTAPLIDTVIEPLYGAWSALMSDREARGVLEVDLPENTVQFDQDGNVAAIVPRQRLDAHRVIEEFMIAANVAAARLLEERQAPCLYRVHDQPDPLKLESLSEYLASMGYRFNLGQTVRPIQFTQILQKARENGQEELLTPIILRAQSQAAYDPDNIGHFGLNLARYAHFTSPIRRYSDLLVHRALIDAYGLGSGGLLDKVGSEFDKAGEHLSMTERRASEAERDAMDRFLASYLESQVGATFAGRISGVTRFGLFVRLSETGADGLVPIKSLPEDYYIHDESRHALVGERWGRVYRLGATVTVRLMEANSATGSTLFDILERDGADIAGADPVPDPALMDRPGRGGGSRGRGPKGGGPRGGGPRGGGPKRGNSKRGSSQRAGRKAAVQGGSGTARSSRRHRRAES